MTGRVLATIGFIALAVRFSYADSIGPLPAQTIIDSNTVGTVAWTNVNLSTTSDTKYSTSGLAKGIVSHYLWHTNYNFNIPASTIDGITAYVQRQSSNSATNMRDNSVKLIKGGVLSGQDKFDGVTDWLATPSTITYPSSGGSTDLWTLTLTTADVNASNFGIAFSATHVSAGVGTYTAAVDNIRLTVYYHLPNPNSVVLNNAYVSSMTASWSLVSAATGYTLALSTNSTNPPNPVFTSSTTIGSSVTTATVQGLWPNTTYYLFVESNGDRTVSTFTAISSSTLANQVANPALFKVFGTSITANWTPFGVGPGTNTCEGYRLDASTASDFSGTIYSSSTSTPTTSTLTVTGLAGLTTYYLRVGAQNYNNVANYVTLGSTATGNPPPGWYNTFVIPETDINWSVAWGDYDGDGKLDLVFGNQINRVYHNNGDGTFTSVWTAPVTESNKSSAWGDYNGDGILDLAFGNGNPATDPTRVYKGNGDGTFNSVWTSAERDSTAQIAWGDADNDGLLDLAEANQSSTNNSRLFKNNGDGSFTSVWTTNNAFAVSWADFNGDGYLDLAFGALPTRVYTNNSDGTFTLAWTASDGASTNYTAVGDLNADGLIDIVGFSTFKATFLNQGNGTFTRVWTSGADSDNGAINIALGDYDTDGNLDLLAGGQANVLPHRVFHSNGDGTFTSVWTSAEAPEFYAMVAWGDYTGDGILDFVVSNSAVAKRLYRGMSWTANNAPNAPTSGFSSTAPSGTLKLRWGNGADSATSAGDLNYALRVSTKTSGSQVQPPYIVPDERIGSPLLTNFLSYHSTSTNDNGVTLSAFKQLLTDNTYYWQVRTIDSGLNSSTWSAVQQIFVSGDNQAPAAVSNLSSLPADIGQVKLTWTSPGDDGATGTLNGTYRIQCATFTITWSTSTTPTGAFTTSITTSNVTPGTTQTATINVVISATTTYCRLWTRDTAGNWSTISNASTATSGGWSTVWTSTETGGSYANGVVADFNGDGVLDFVAGTSVKRLFKGNGDGTFTSLWTSADSDSSNAFVAGDLDGDGFVDLITGQATKRVYKNNGNGTFSSIWTSPDSESSTALAIGDFTNDGLLDFVSVGNAAARLYQNNGSFAFGGIWSDSSNAFGNSTGGADFDGDGDLDLAILGSSLAARVYRNMGSGNFVSIWTSDTVDFVTLAIADLNGDGNLDLAMGLSNVGPTYVYRNNNDGTFTTIWTSADTNNDSDLAFGDYNADGNMDLLCARGAYLTRIYRGNGDGSLSSVWTGVSSEGHAKWLDANQDGMLDFVALPNSSAPRLNKGTAQVNSAPNAPTGGFSSTNSGGQLTLRWGNGSDTETVTTADLTYAVRVSTKSTGSQVQPPYEVAEERVGNSLMGNYLTYHSTSTNDNRILLTRFKTLQSDNTYYWQVRTIDSGLRSSTWTTSVQQIFVAGDATAPSAITNLTAMGGPDVGQLKLTWTTPGDNGTSGTLNGLYYVQCATYTATWSTSTTGSSVLTLTISTSNVTPLTTQTTILSNLLSVTTYYCRVWTQDKSGNWSGISNGATTTTAGWTSVWTSADTADGTHAIAWGDFNGDGNLDLLTGNATQPKRAYQGNGSGTFTSVWTSADTDATAGITVGDFNGDGILDFATANTTVAKRVYKGNGDGTFSSIWTSADTGDTDNAVACADEDLDGALDLAFGASGAPLRIYHNNGSATFTSIWTSGDTSETASVAWGDYTGDGYPDIIEGNGISMSGFNRLFHNNGDGTFTSIILNLATQSSSMAWGDYNGDGLLDYIDGGANLVNAFVYRNNGDGTFTSVWSTPDNDTTTQVAWGDYNGDGLLDFAKGNSGQVKRVYRNNADGTFTSVWTSADTGATKGFVWGDYNNDGVLDLAAGNFQQVKRVYRGFGLINTAPSAPTSGFSTANNSGRLTLRWGNGSDTETTDSDDLTYSVRLSTKLVSSQVSPPYIIAGERIGSPLMGNFLSYHSTSTNDNSVALAPLSTLVANNTYYWQVRAIDTGLRSSTWTSVQQLFLAGDAVAPASVTNLSSILTTTAGVLKFTWTAPGDDGTTGTLNGVFRIQCATYTAVWSTTSTPSGAFTTSITTSNVTPLTPQTAYMTGLAGATPYYCRLWTEDDSANWSAISNGSTATTAGWYQSFYIADADANRAIAWGDYDNDGLLDLAFANNTQYKRVYKNNGNATFTSVWTSADTADAAKSIAWGDYDGDGNLDLVSGGTSVKRVYRNTGGGTFSSVWTSADADDTRAVAWADYNNDGLIDLGTGNYGLPTRVYKNNGNGTFSSAWTSTESNNANAFAWGDFDGNGTMDIAVGNTGVTRVYQNNGDGSFTSVWTSADSDMTDSIAWGDLDGDGQLDLVAGKDFGVNGRVYNNNRNSTFSSVSTWSCPSQQPAPSLALADINNDAFIDLLSACSPGNQIVFSNNGSSNFSSVWLSSETISGTGIAVADYDNDGVIDFAVATNTQLPRIYKGVGIVNSSPTAPTSGFSTSYSQSKIMLRWGNGSDTESTDPDDLLYAVRLSTKTSGTQVQPPYIIPDERLASPLNGSYLSPRDVTHGDQRIFISSTIAQLQQNNTYYWQTRTLDTGLRSSTWTSVQQFFIAANPQPPAAVTNLSALAGAACVGGIQLTWTSPGEDGNSGTLNNSTFTIQATTSSTFTGWDPVATAPSYTTLTNIAITGVTPGSSQSYSMNGLTNGTTYYFRIWTKDSQRYYSNISNGATTYAAAGSGGGVLGSSVTNVSDGLWSNPTTWGSCSNIPSSTTVVAIATNTTVTVDISSATASTTTVYGTLKFNRTGNNQLSMVGGNIDVYGTLDMGRDNDNIPAGTTAYLILSSGTFAGQYGLNIKLGGNFVVFGSTKNPASYVPGTVTLGPGSASVSVADATGWQEGDLILIDTEAVNLSGLVGNSFNVSGLGLAHYSTFGVVVSNLTRNTLVRSSGTVLFGGSGNSSYINNLATNATSFYIKYGEFAYVGSNGGSNPGISFGSGSSMGSISSSTIRNGYTGIYLNGCNATVVGNTIYRNSNPGVSASSIQSGSVISANRFVSNVNEGLYLNGGQNLTFSSNRFLNNTYGISFAGASSNTISNSFFYGNIYGLYSSNSQGNICRSCDIGYSTTSVSWPDTGMELQFAAAGQESIILQNSRLNPTNSVDYNDLTFAGSYVLSYDQDYSTGAVKLWGDYNVSGSSFTLDYASETYTGAGDASYQKKLYFGPAPSASWNGSSSRSRVIIPTGATFEAIGTTANPTLVDVFSGFTNYYIFVDSGGFTINNTTWTNMCEQGLQLTGSAGVSMANSAFNFFANNRFSTSTYITATSMNSTAVFSGLYFGNGRANTNNHNFTVVGSDASLSWTLQQYSGPLAGQPYEANDPNDKIKWGFSQQSNGFLMEP